MYSLRITNSRNQTLNLTADESKYQVMEITGLSSPGASVNTTAIYGMAGGVFNSSHVENRAITITLKVNGYNDDNRMALYNYFPTGERVRFWFSTDAFSAEYVYIDGYVEKLECNAFTNKVIAQISIVCPFPYFRAQTPTTRASATSHSFTYNGSVECGAEFVFSIITNTSTFGAADGNGNVMKLAAYTGYFQAGDTVRINTKQGEKSAVLIHNSNTTNVIKWLTSDSIFLNIKQGTNSFSVIDESVCRFGLIYNTTYRGV